jgi:hypothetical protein
LRVLCDAGSQNSPTTDTSISGQCEGQKPVTSGEIGAETRVLRARWTAQTFEETGIYARVLTSSLRKKDRKTCAWNTARVREDHGQKQGLKPVLIKSRSDINGDWLLPEPPYRKGGWGWGVSFQKTAQDRRGAENHGRDLGW